jgi:hypothetical protein
MKPYVFIFRQAKSPLTEDQLKQRAEEVRAWALHLRDEGHTMEPRILGQDSLVAAPLSSDGAAAEIRPITAILMVDFVSFEEAKRCAETHPGRRYGASVEVREAFPPPGAAPAR